ncbi:MAG: DNA repair protein RecN, partial [Oscillospiraceae bacterium]
VNVSLLKEIGTELINIHGQHDNQVLLSPEKHIDILDKYGDFSVLLEEYLECYKNVVQIKREMKKASTSQTDKAERIELLTYQVDEITGAELSLGEDTKLEAKRNEVRNSARIIESLSLAHNALFGDNGEGGAVDLAKFATSSAQRASEFYEPVEEICTRLEGISAELEEIAEEIYNKLDSFEFNQNYLDSIEARINEIHKLKRNYGDSVEKILEYCVNAKEELSTLELCEQHLLELDESGKKEYAKLLSLAKKITEQRKEAAERFIKYVTSELIFLDMPNVCLEVLIEHVKPNSKGQNNVEFLISTNKGEPPKPIAKIASGGELSRIMLAIKNTLADKDEIQTLIFDEIDTGVSGRAAQKIGLKLKQAATTRQIITVTHLAQIAALADHHYLIKKDSDAQRTFTNVTKLDYDGRVDEVARIMSTDQITDLMLENAKAMINAN